MKFRRHEATAFHSPHTQDQMLERLNAVGSRTWRARDSEHHGDYLSSITYGDGDEECKLKIFERDGDEQLPFAIDVLFLSDAADAAEKWRVIETYVRDALSAVGATRLTATDDYG
jgi:hypothetical protein